MKEFKMATTFTEIELHKIFGNRAKYVMAGNFYYIYFNGKDLSAETPKELFEKVKENYSEYVQRNK